MLKANSTQITLKTLNEAVKPTRIDEILVEIRYLDQNRPTAMDSALDGMDVRSANRLYQAVKARYTEHRQQLVDELEKLWGLK